MAANQKEKIKYPVGIQSFPEIIEGGYLYVDKTATLHKLFDGKYYFLSRPRRFGKSLMLSTLEAYFEGRRDLFKGLALDRLTDDWEPHPVLHLDLNTGEYRTPEDLKEQLCDALEDWEEMYGDEKNHKSPAIRFRHVIRNAYRKTGKKVVILVDEYDKPVLNAIGNETLEDDFSSQLKAFYGNLKTMDEYIEFAMLTGVARFSKLSVFSDLNNLNDISFASDFADICGVTDDELKEYFQSAIISLGKHLGKTGTEIQEMLRRNYDGYHFAKISPDIYNPFSLMNVFSKHDMASYWFQSGTPTFLIRLLNREKGLLQKLIPTRIDAEELMSTGIFSGHFIPALYQAGYLTIKAYEPDGNRFLLDYPNREVKEGFLKLLVPHYLRVDGLKGEFAVQEFISEIREGRADLFMKRLDTLLRGVPYLEKGSSEAHFQNAVYLLFTLMGFEIKVEERTSNGRIDLYLETGSYIYIMEFKVDSSAETAMTQILKKEYYAPYQLTGKEIYLIGASFDTRTRRLTDWLIEKK